MRIANVAGRSAIIIGGVAVDINKASDGRFSPQVQELYSDWESFSEWATGVSVDDGVPFDPANLGSPAPSPRQLFAIGLNYLDHAKESGLEAPDTMPPVFTKFQSSITGPISEVELPSSGQADWEVELVAVISKEATDVQAGDAWNYIAGLTVGQDLSDRQTQLVGPIPQFSLGKSLPGFTPMGPWLVTPDEFANPDDLALGCEVNGEELQSGRTSSLIFSVPQLIEKLSSILTLLPGDVIFTGTPEGVGLGRSPQRWLQAGDVLRSHVEGIGELEQRFVGAS